MIRSTRPATCFGGRLLLGEDGWRWRDGAPEPRVATVPSGGTGYAVRSDGGVALVAVPWLIAEFYDPLRWVIEAARDGEIDCEVGTEAPRRRVLVSPTRVAALMHALVPLERWRAWCAFCAVVPAWSCDDHLALERRAGTTELRGARLTPV